MPNSPQENLTPPSGTDPEVTLAPDGSAVDGLVEDVLRDARSLLGESAAGESNEEMDPDSAGDRPEMDAEELLSDLERLSDDLVAEVEASATDPASGTGLQEGGIKRGPAARDLGTEGPQVDLFGMASRSEAPSSASRPPMASDQHGSDAAVPMNSDSADTNDEASSPAAALEALMASRIAEEFEADEPSTSTLDMSSCATVTSEITKAEAAERAAVASLDAMGGKHPVAVDGWRGRSRLFRGSPRPGGCRHHADRLDRTGSARSGDSRSRTIRHDERFRSGLGVSSLEGVDEHVHGSDHRSGFDRSAVRSGFDDARRRRSSVVCRGAPIHHRANHGDAFQAASIVGARPGQCDGDLTRLLDSSGVDLRDPGTGGIRATAAFRHHEGGSERVDRTGFSSRIA